jgi:CDP-diacylglycerol--glycerol-3-phosphate 3-phosphatidyltransferase
VSDTEQKGALEQFGYANVVTMVRIFAIPIFLVVLLVDWPSIFSASDLLYPIRPWVAAFVFAILAATDGVDGYIARSRGEISTFGKFADPLADKLLITAALLALIEVNVLPAWVAFVIISREFVVSGLRMVASVEGLVIDASWYGKIKTFLQIVAIVLFIIMASQWFAQLDPVMHNLYRSVSWFCMGAAVVMTIMSMIEYFAGASKVITGPWNRNGS